MALNASAKLYPVSSMCVQATNYITVILRQALSESLGNGLRKGYGLRNGLYNSLSNDLSSSQSNGDQSVSKLDVLTFRNLRRPMGYLSNFSTYCNFIIPLFMKVIIFLSFLQRVNLFCTIISVLIESLLLN